MRDSLIRMAGKLDETVGGQPVNIVDEPYSYRRSIYGRTLPSYRLIKTGKSTMSFRGVHNGRPQRERGIMRGRNCGHL
jgi:hypothetical protein